MLKSLRLTATVNSVALPEDSDVELRHFSKIGQSESEESASSYTIAHISDPHLSRRYYREHIKSLKILLRSILEAGCDHVIISGDIVSTADPDDFFLAREVFANLGLLDSNRLTVVPGNHDIFGGPHRAIDVLSFPTYIRSVDYRKNIALFHEAFAETFENIEPLIPGELYPFVKRAGPYSIIGLNSIPPWSMFENPLGTNGVVDDQQMSALRGLLSSDRFAGSIPVVAVHHHFNDLVDAATDSSFWLRIESKTMRLKKRRKLLKLFAGLGVKFVFHGHIHRNEVYERYGIQLANGAGAVCDDPLANLKYNMLMQKNGTAELKTNHLPVPYQSSTVMQKIHWKPRRAAVPGLNLELSGK